MTRVLIREHNRNIVSVWSKQGAFPVGRRSQVHTDSATPLGFKRKLSRGHVYEASVMLQVQRGVHAGDDTFLQSTIGVQ